jgi:hypothetical protein
MRFICGLLIIGEASVYRALSSRSKARFVPTFDPRPEGIVPQL